MGLSKSYSKLIQIPDYYGRLQYLRLYGDIGDETFGKYRYLNQKFYTSPQWRSARNHIIFRDNGCEFGLPGFDIPKGQIMVHHINPITIDDIVNCDPKLFDPENLITMSMDTHKRMVTYGTEEQIAMIDRRPNDTCPWKN